MQPTKTQIGGQTAWLHDKGAADGTFCTFDSLKLKGFPSHKVHVWRPNEQADERPLLLLNDGQAAFFPGGLSGDSILAHEAALAWSRQTGRPAPMVVGVCPNDRNWEYQQLRLLGGGGLPEYARYLADALVPFLESCFSLISDPPCRIVAGASHGGLAAFYTAAVHPDVFGGAICMSSSFWSNHPDPQHDTALLPHVMEGLKGPHRPRFWIDWGMVRSGGPHNVVIEWLATAAGRMMVRDLQHHYGYTVGQDLFWQEDPDGQHTEKSWQRRLPAALKALMPTE